MSSYGPVIALSNLSSNLLQTLASGERVLSLLAEEPELKDVESAVDLKDVSCIDVENVNFAYGEEQILSDVSLSVKKGEILGIHGRSGSGKSTLLKLLMRFTILNQVALKLTVKLCQISTPVAYVTIWRTLLSKPIFSTKPSRKISVLLAVMQP